MDTVDVVARRDVEDDAERVLACVGLGRVEPLQIAPRPDQVRARVRDVRGRIGALGLPTVTVMEGGYNVAALGRNVAAFIAGLEGA